MINIIQFATMETPTNYGWFHIMFLFIMLFGTIAVCFFGRNLKDKYFRIVIAAFWLVFVGLEIYKQTTYVWDGEKYQWYAFPFQFCSSPLYALPFIAFLPNGKVRQAFMAFASLFIFFGGLAVYAFPNDVFVTRTGINIQTMVHHGMQIVTGVYITIWNRKEIAKGLYENNFKKSFISMIWYFLKGAIVFVGFVAVAVFLNEGIARWFPQTSAMNMFFISTINGCSLPVLSSIYPLVPPVVFIFIYLFGFMLVGFIMLWMQYGFICLDKIATKIIGKYRFDGNAYVDDYNLINNKTDEINN